MNLSQHPAIVRAAHPSLVRAAGSAQRSRADHYKRAPAPYVGRAAYSVKSGSVKEDGTFAGYGSRFDAVDRGGEMVKKGAFVKSLKAATDTGVMPALLWQHLPEEPIGLWTKLEEDDDGLYCEGRILLDFERGRQAHSLLKAGAISGLSIGYDLIAGGQDRDSNAKSLTEIDLWEVSLVTFPMLLSARIDLGSVKTVSAPADADIARLAAAIDRRTAALAHLLQRVA